jgi:hypothetical protein
MWCSTKMPHCDFPINARTLYVLTTDTDYRLQKAAGAPLSSRAAGLFTSFPSRKFVSAKSVVAQWLWRTTRKPPLAETPKTDRAVTAVPSSGPSAPVANCRADVSLAAESLREEVLFR